MSGPIHPDQYITHGALNWFKPFNAPCLTRNNRCHAQRHRLLEEVLDAVSCSSEFAKQTDLAKVQRKQIAHVRRVRFEDEA